MLEATKEKTANPFNQFNSDIWMLILFFAGNPVYFGRVMQLSKTFQKKLTKDVKPGFLEIYWKYMTERDFWRIRKKPDNLTYKDLYIGLSEARKETCDLSNEYRRLFNYIRSDDLESIRKEYSEIDLSNIWTVVDNGKSNAIILACQYNRTQILKYLFNEHIIKKITIQDEAAAPLLVDKQGMSKFHWSAACGFSLGVAQLLKEVKVDHPDKLKRTALYFASFCGHLNIVETLLNAGANINTRAIDGSTPLIVACQKNNLSLIRGLLNSRANIDLADQDGFTAFTIACREGSFDAVKELVATGKININFQMADNLTGLMLACVNGHQRIVEFLLERDVELNTVDDEGKTALFYASLNGDPGIVSALIAKGAVVDQANSNGETPFIIACSEGNLEAMRVLIKAKANIHRITPDGKSGLMSACECAQDDAVEELLTKTDVDVNQTNPIGRTGLMLACAEGSYGAVELLIKYGADANRVTPEGLSALHFAALNGNVKCFQKLLPAQPNLEQTALEGATPLLAAISDLTKISKRKIEFVRAILKAGANPNTNNVHSGTPLHLACDLGCTEMVKALLAHNADTTVIFDEKLPIDVAQQNKHHNIYILLLLWDIKEKNKNLSICKQVSEILKASIYHNMFGFVLSFFPTPAEEKSLLTKLQELDDGISKGAFTFNLREFIQKNASIIPKEKYEFIMEFLLNDEKATNELPVEMVDSHSETSSFSSTSEDPEFSDTEGVPGIQEFIQKAPATI